ncbi:Toluene efflux pump periplasmic linker protein TtgG precursor [Enhygromyxa salina]|uniref:Toluene efflux pump periplasmic linker protein TtgG n=1 Tax=Enhygromyxa salina TaxID=215803 RepID=A0A2S9YK84_9BACT|nr:efflux RND transporter periplasmic adaptor subunit [Enhygromyxa salina]PRQ05442.1 Toluene efflux pump periplasmic linker protein TtgG precursor [Enhygromyxa salina]
MPRLRRGPWARALLGLSVWVSPACGERGPEPVEAPRPVKTFELGAADDGFSREWPGRVEPTQNAEMSFAVAGDIVELPVEEGMLVAKDQLLATLDARHFRARLDRARAQLRFDQTEYERSATLVERGAVARAELDRRTRALAVSEAELAEAKKALADTELVAPFAGTVAKKLVDNFQSVAAKQPVVVIQDATSLEIVTHVSQRDYAAAKPGLTVAERSERAAGRVHVVLDTLPELLIPARLKELATVPDPITGTYEVTWSFDPPQDVMITPGMTAKVIVAGLAPEAVEARAVLVPIEALVGSDEGGAQVWVIEPETMTVARAEVETGAAIGGSVEVRAGLDGDELIATTGVHALRDGLVVTRFEDLYGRP